MSTEPIDRDTRVMSTFDQADENRSALSPFFIAAVGTTIALVAVAAMVALLS